LVLDNKFLIELKGRYSPA